jgi:hypothetical protein
MTQRSALSIFPMYRKPRFLEELHAIREEMSRDCDYDVDLFSEMVRSGRKPRLGPVHNIRGRRVRAPGQPAGRRGMKHGHAED